MVKSIVIYIKLWFKCDYKCLIEAKTLDELLLKFDNLQNINS
jgi:hypothetical protein